MKIKRYVLTVAVSDAEATRFTEQVVEDACAHGIDMEPGSGSCAVTFMDERTVDIPDYDVKRDGENVATAWLERSAIEVFKD